MMKLKDFFNHPYFIAGLYGVAGITALICQDLILAIFVAAGLLSFAILHGMSCSVITNRNFEIHFSGNEDAARTLLAGMLEKSDTAMFNGEELADAKEEKA